MVLDILTLTVERVVDNPVRLVLGAVETALDDVAGRSRTSLLGQAEAETLHIALGKHGWENQLGDWCCKQLSVDILKLKCDEGSGGLTKCVSWPRDSPARRAKTCCCQEVAYVSCQE